MEIGVVYRAIIYHRDGNGSNDLGTFPTRKEASQKLRSEMIRIIDINPTVEYEESVKSYYIPTIEKIDVVFIDRHRKQYRVLEKAISHIAN
jgi:hypothetical protein